MRQKAWHKISWFIKIFWVNECPSGVGFTIEKTPRTESYEYKCQPVFEKESKCVSETHKSQGQEHNHTQLMEARTRSQTGSKEEHMATKEKYPRQWTCLSRDESPSPVWAYGCVEQRCVCSSTHPSRVVGKTDPQERSSPKMDSIMEHPEKKWDRLGSHPVLCQFKKHKCQKGFSACIDSCGGIVVRIPRELSNFKSILQR